MAAEFTGICAVLKENASYSQSKRRPSVLLRKIKKGKKAKAQGFTPFSPFGFFPGGTLALEFALIALLFAVPFFW